MRANRVGGAVVTRLYAKGPAAEAGLQAGDVIVAIDGYEVIDARTAQYRLTTRGVGNRSRLDVVRKGKRTVSHGKTTPKRLEAVLENLRPGRYLLRVDGQAKPVVIEVGR